MPTDDSNAAGTAHLANPCPMDAILDDAGVIFALIPATSCCIFAKADCERVKFCVSPDIDPFAFLIDVSARAIA